MDHGGHVIYGGVAPTQTIALGPPPLPVSEF
jgi:hypothetical protein